jgi:hydrogenase nickel incorporation protein HypB
VCGTCGCDEGAGPRYTRLPDPGHQHEHGHAHGHGNEHGPEHGHGHGHEPSAAPRTVVLEERVLARNDDLAARNRRELAAHGIVAINLMSSPGSGKTTLLERTIAHLALRRAVGVLEGDQETAVDAARIRAAGAPVVQINTGAGCHLDAGMLHHGLSALAPAPGSLVFVENVGNLVCPALFDLGESGRVVVMSVPEGDDKPVKYPHMFRTADLVLINKIDLLPYVDFDPDRCAAQIRSLNPATEVHLLSATRGDGMAAWYAWLAERAPAGPAAGSLPVDNSASRV